MKKIAETIQPADRPVRMIQFGEGNFLRAFVDWMVDIANEQGTTDIGIAVVQPIPTGTLPLLRDQQGLYTVLLRGKQDGSVVDQGRTVTSISCTVDAYQEFEKLLALARLDSVRFIVSNTTEAGIAITEADDYEGKPPVSYPAKLTRFLYERYIHFQGAPGKGLILLPVELIEHNGDKLRACVLQLASRWGLPEAFAQWVEQENIFCNTLVDRIVTGYPQDEAPALWQAWGYRDEAIVVGEPFALWVIESKRYEEARKALPLDGAGLPVVFTEDLFPFRDRKVRLLNGGHTGMVPAAFLAGLDTVGQCMEDPLLRRYLETLLYQEIASCVKLPREEVDAFARSVVERFENPFIKHRLLSIMLNSVSKWKVRVLPSLLDRFAAAGQLPRLLTFSFAALISFYRSDVRGVEGLKGSRAGENYPILDDAGVLDFFAGHAKLSNAEYARACAANADFWGCDLAALPGFVDQTADWLDCISEKGMRGAVEEVMA